ncbi:MAG: hypothetical protein GKR94_19800 [Gammaproteobacteria bacterium]|nr:hypothetical protein [Gammaproteobacteria bacterium]
MRLAYITPADLRGWLDELPIKWKVIAVSARHYLEPLAGEHTMVLVAAKAMERSFDCGDDQDMRASLIIHILKSYGQ